MSNKIYIKVNGVWREADSVYRKRNGVWQKASDDVYKKINGAWANQGDKSAIFDQDALFVYNDFRVDENVSAHVNVTCFDGGDGSVTVVASGGTPPYQYSLDPTFATYNTDGVFSNLSLVAPVDEGTDEYGGILISHRRFYVRDASGQIVSCVVDLKSPVALEWRYDENFYTLVSESDSSINLSCVLYADEQGTEYVPNVDFNAPYVSTTKNVRTLAPTGYPSNYIFYPNQTYNVQYSARNTTCDELQYCRIAITVLPNE